MLALAGLLPVGAVTFATERLQAIAKCLSLPGLDNLEKGTYTHYKYQSHDLCVRVNSYGEVEHIGLFLFPQWRRDANQSSPVYDFLERNLLERQLPNIGESTKFQLAGEHVYFLTGNAQRALATDTADIYGFSEERRDFKTYRVAWTKQGREWLKVSFDMDYQLLSGCNSMELDSHFLKKLRRFRPHPYQKKEFRFPRHTNVYVAAGDTFLIKEFHNELFYENKNGEWRLSDSKESLSRLLNNMMLGMEFEGDMQLTLSLDQHSDEKEPLTIPYKNWLQLCLDEGCTPFFGIKDVGSAHCKGTVLMTNARSGYVHLLSVEIPKATVDQGGNGSVRGYLFPYIPMHNVSNDYFKK